MGEITFAHTNCFYCKSWSDEAENEVIRIPGARVGLAGDYHHWARYDVGPTPVILSNCNRTQPEKRKP